MVAYYKFDIIPIILNRFKVSNVVLSGNLDEETYNQVLRYCEVYNCSCMDFSKEKSVLNNLADLNDYDAIFINDDPNWYTVFNELNVIKENNNEFPLVFICNNIFPHKRRDSYKDPDTIPEEFLNEFSRNLEFNDINIKDNFYHAIEENTSKNGVLTAIEDFLSKNASIGIMDISLLNGITILYPKNSISQIRLGKLSDEIRGYKFYYDISDEIVENQLLVDHCKKFDLNGEKLDIINDFKSEIEQKEIIINDYEDKIELHNAELNLKNSQINNFDSKLNIKDAEIKNIESKLINRENEVNNLNIELQNANNQINSLKSDISQKELLEKELNIELQNANTKIEDNVRQLDYKENILNQKEDLIKNKQIQLNNKEKELISINQKYINQLSKLDTKEYCISCYKEEITNNHLEIEYLKKDNLTRKILSPFAYIYLILKSNPHEISINLKLYKALKNSKCFDIGFYLNKNPDLRNSNWCKYFSPELHYVCNGFNEEREFNKKYFNRNSKKELLDYIINCP